MDINGQAAIVTGAASGLGAATARALAAAGAKVAVLDVNEQAALKVANAIGGLAAPCDVASSEEVAAALKSAASVHRPARILRSIVPASDRQSASSAVTALLRSASSSESFGSIS